MPMSLEDFVGLHLTITLSQLQYGQHFGLGRPTHIGTSPTQHVQSFVDDEGVPYRFMVVGRLMSFKVVEDSVGPTSLYTAL
jgi:hypothetical protein